MKRMPRAKKLNNAIMHYCNSYTHIHTHTLIHTYTDFHLREEHDAGKRIVLQIGYSSRRGWRCGTLEWYSILFGIKCNIFVVACRFLYVMFVIDFEMYGMVEYGVKKVDEPQVKGTLFSYFMAKIQFFCDDKCFV